MLIDVNDFDSKEAITAIARQYIASMVETQQDMFADLTLEEQKDMSPPTADDIRDMTVDYANDILNDFKISVIDVIKAAKFNPDYKVEIELKSSLTFEE